MSPNALRVWVDCTAAAHPLVLRPLIERLERRGHDVSVTARDYGQTQGILDRLGIEHADFGRHVGGSAATKGVEVARRSAALTRWARGQEFDLGLGHGSVDLAAVGTLLGIPTVQMQDYEHAGLQRQLAFRAARRVLAPDAIDVTAMRRAGAAERKLFRYPGLKEDYYLADFEPDRSALAELSIPDDRVLVVVRPPPETSAYHERNALYSSVLDRLGSDPATVAVVIPRTTEQAAELRSRAEPSLIVPEQAVDAQSLIAFADLVVSAGGTMNREAVALGTPVYTIFSGRMGAVDERLIGERRLRPLSSATALELVKREDSPGPRNPRDPELLVEAALGAIDVPTDSTASTESTESD
jgi:predicted glycosyltransferase